MRNRPGLAVLAAVPLALAMASPALASVASTPRRTASVNGTVHSVLESGGIVYLAGAFTRATDSSGTVTRNNVAAISVSTGQLTGWNPNANGAVDALAVSGGEVYLGGNFSAVGGAGRRRLTKVNATSGGVSAGFVHNANADVHSLAVNGTRLYAAGGFTSVDGTSRAHLAAFSLSSGALDATWKPAANGPVRVVTTAGTRVYVGGNFTTLNGSSAHRFLGAVSATSGATDGAFAAGIGYLVDDVAATGTAVYAAADGPGGHLRAFTLGGANLWNVTSDGGFQAVTVLAGEIYAGGHFDNICSTPRTGANGTCLDGRVTRHKLASVSSSGTLTAWAPQANSTLGVTALDSSSTNGTVAAGGAFTAFKLGAVSQPHFALFG